MRFLTIAVATTLLLLPAAQQANACSGASAQATATELSAVEKKPAKKKMAKKKREKVEYMRAAPMK